MWCVINVVRVVNVLYMVCCECRVCVVHLVYYGESRVFWYVTESTISPVESTS